jgi:hypothetical protein
MERLIPVISLIRGYASFCRPSGPPRCSLDEDRIATPIATKILRRTLADGLTLAFERKLDAAHATLNGPSVAV